MPLRTIAAVCCDLETNGLGLPSRLLDPFRGELLLLRVLRRALRCPRFGKVLLLASPRDAGRLKGLALPARAELLVSGAADVPQRAWLRRSRKWAVDGWRGGIGWTTAFDEEGPPAALLEACRREGADAVVRLPSHAPFLDPGLLSALVDLHLRRRDTFQFTFAQAPPGLLGEAYHPEFLETMARHHLTPRNALMVRAGQEGMDPQRSECHLDAGEPVRNSPYRLTCESPRLWRLCEALAAEEAARGEEMDAAALVAHLDARPDLWRGEGPREILADPAATRDLPDPDVPPAAAEGAALDPWAWAGWLRAATAGGDTTVTLGVRGEPLAHPRWREVVEAAAAAYGVHLRTSGLRLDAETAEALVHAPLDVITVRLDAAAAGTYARVHGADALGRVREGLDCLVAAQRRVGTSAPLVALEFLLRRETEGELGAWWAEWQGKVDWLSLRGFTTFGGQVEDRAALPLAAPGRRPCLKLSRLLYVRADGIVMPCAEGLASEPGLGSLAEGGAALWAGPALAALRGAHAAGQYPSSAPPCAACREWGWV